jgi:hypothetical protein
MLKEFLNNDKSLAMLLVTLICCLAMWKLEGSAKDIILPAITGIFGVVTGMGMKAGSGPNQPTTVPQIEEATKIDVAKIAAGKEVEAAKTEGETAK